MLAIEVVISLPALLALRVLEEPRVTRGLPVRIVIDHGSEFTSKASEGTRLNGPIRNHSPEFQRRNCGGTVSCWDYYNWLETPVRRLSVDTPDSHDITQLLAAWGGGDQAAFEKLVPLVYAELKRIARRYMFRESEVQVLQTTALVHEAYMKMVSQKGAKWQDRAHFFAVSSQQMRRILVDAARARLRKKRGAEAVVVSLDDAPALSAERAANFIALDDALNELGVLDPRRSRVVEMRYFGGMTVDETAAAMNLSPETILRDWKAAKAWLYTQLNRTEAPSVPGPPK